MCLTSICTAQNRYALLIGISRYNTAATGWERIHGANDIALIKNVLSGFSVETLLDEQATFTNIKESMKRLAKRVRYGDVVYIHMSGHGQPVEDYNGDESDGWDEAFIPYDANMQYRKGRYEGENHLVDDILHGFVELLRKRLGKRGIVYVCIDACHSGTSYMGDGGNVSASMDDQCIDDLSVEPETVLRNYERGTAYGFSKNKKIYRPEDVTPKKSTYISTSNGLSKVVMLESCEENQRNYEICLNMRNGGKFYCGLLSYSVYKSLADSKLLMSTNTSWIRSVEQNFFALRPAYSSQKMVVERTR